ncbi:MAG TPA: hypothetical protein VEU73_08475 [Gemmatimonadales bacterium]|nr:hypothetical protein [Gemmatimonadales bacterium]
MPTIARWFIRTSLIAFVAALLVGIAQAAPQAPAAVVAVGPVYVHLLVVGWITQMIFGVAYWMFPKSLKDAPRGSDSLAIASYVCLNVGLLLRVLGEPVHTLHPTAGLGWTLVLSALLQWLGGMAFVVNTWARVKER